MNLSRVQSPVLRFFSRAGFPLSGGKLYTYKAGTEMPVTTYKTKGGIANSNPVQLNARGECEVWIDPSQPLYLVWKSALGVVEGTADHVTTNTRTFKAECNDGTMDVVEREEDGVTTYTFGLKDNSIGWAKLKEPRHLIADTDWVEFEAQPNSDYVVVSLAPALRTWLEEQGYNG